MTKKKTKEKTKGLMDRLNVSQGVRVRLGVVPSGVSLIVVRRGCEIRVYNNDYGCGCYH